MQLSKAFNEIHNYSHMWNWSPDWEICRRIYISFPNSYAVLTPFAFSYLEELIRSTTSEYGRELIEENHGQKNHRKVGIKLIDLAIKENKLKNPEYTTLLEEYKHYFKSSTSTDNGDNRNSVHHGYMHPRFWTQESFEKLIYDIAKISKYAGF